jgi:choline dehydrogenase-like flavoprotein
MVQARPAHRTSVCGPQVRRVHVTGSRPDLRVPFREVRTSEGEIVRLYDTAGPELGACIMGHWTTYAFAIFLSERLHSYRNRSTSHALDDFCDPDFPGARLAARAAGLPHFRGGTLEMGGTQHPIAEARTYLELLPLLSPGKPFGRRFKELMRASLLRDRLAGIAMVGEDLAQRSNRITLDPRRPDEDGLPGIRTAYRPHRHELAAQRFYLPWLTAICKASGAEVAAALPGDTPEGQPGLLGSHGLAFSHNVGGMRMGTHPKRSVCDPYGRLWGLPNVGVADGAVFPTSGGHNPTLTIMAVALRNARAWAAGSGP